MGAVGLWHDGKLVASPGVRRVSLGGRATLFCEHRQQIYELNSTADAVWLSLTAGLRPGDASRALSASLGIDESEAASFVAAAAAQWLSDGQLVPSDALVQLEGKPDLSRPLRLDDVSIQIALFGRGAQSLEPQLSAVFGQFYSEASTAGARISLVASRSGFFLFDGLRPAGFAGADEWMPKLKALVTGLYLEARRSGFLAHAALLEHRGRGLLICGRPGGGKTTLSAALQAEGFDYRSDDIVKVETSGQVTGLKFAPAVKSGSWSLLEACAPELAEEPVWLRGDGQRVKYLPVERGTSNYPLNIGWVVLLDRRDREPATLTPADPLQVLSHVLESAYSSGGQLRADGFAGLAGALGAATLWRLTYSDLHPAIDLIRSSTHE